MDVLPWLVIHGAAVWQAGLALFVLAGLLFALLRPRLAARRAAQAARRQVGEPVTRLRGVRRDARVTLEGRLEVGDGAVVGACAVVTRDVEPWTIVAGNPAKPIKKRVLADKPTDTSTDKPAEK